MESGTESAAMAAMALRPNSSSWRLKPRSTLTEATEADGNMLHESETAPVAGAATSRKRKMPEDSAPAMRWHCHTCNLHFEARSDLAVHKGTPVHSQQTAAAAAARTTGEMREDLDIAD